MPAVLQGTTELIDVQVLETLWEETKRYRRCGDSSITVRIVDEAESRRLNEHYRDTPRPTNVLTFSYDEHMHDIALCEDVARREAAARSVPAADYTALLVVHGLLHATGLDHERSAAEAEQTKVAEAAILTAAGHPVITW